MGRVRGNRLGQKACGERGLRPEIVREEKDWNWEPRKRRLGLYVWASMFGLEIMENRALEPVSGVGD